MFICSRGDVRESLYINAKYNPARSAVGRWAAGGGGGSWRGGLWGPKTRLIQRARGRHISTLHTQREKDEGGHAEERDGAGRNGSGKTGPGPLPANRTPPPPSCASPETASETACSKRTPPRFSSPTRCSDSGPTGRLATERGHPG